ncbi:hypothetical protein M153_9970000956, partial [Pseudoloma neurophilia]
QNERFTHHMGSFTTSTNFPITNPSIYENDLNCLSIVFEKGEGVGETTIAEMRETGRIKRKSDIVPEE